jgi:hypothetical protein
VPSLRRGRCRPRSGRFRGEGASPPIDHLPSIPLPRGTAARARGRGVAHRALQALTDWAFTAFPGDGLTRLELLHQVDNTASCRGIFSDDPLDGVKPPQYDPARAVIPSLEQVRAIRTAGDHAFIQSPVWPLKHRKAGEYHDVPLPARISETTEWYAEKYGTFDGYLLRQPTDPRKPYRHWGMDNQWKRIRTSGWTSRKGWSSTATATSTRRTARATASRSRTSPSGDPLASAGGLAQVPGGEVEGRGCRAAAP